MKSRSLKLCWVASLALLVGLPTLLDAQIVPRRYVAFGDSITFGVGDDLTRTRIGYPPRLEALLNGAGQNTEVINQGKGAERTPEGLTRLPSALVGGADVLLLMEGTNDITRDIGIETTRQNLNTMAAYAEARAIQVVMATPIWRIPNANVDRDNVLNQRLTELIRNTAGNRNRLLVDNFEIFGALPNRFGEYYLIDPLDGVGHPNPAGYDVMAQAFFNVLTGADRVPPVTGLTTPLAGARNVNGGAPIRLDVWDFGAGVDAASTQLLINGTPVSATLDGSGRRVSLVYQPPQAFNGLVRVGLRARDLAATPNTVDREVLSFLVFGTTFLTGDIDRDGRVDGKDLTRLARAFGARTGETRYFADADFNGDGVVDGTDLAGLAANFGRVSG